MPKAVSFEPGGLATDELRVVLAAPALDESSLAHWHGVMSQPENMRATRSTDPLKKSLLIARRGLLRTFLGGLLGCAPRDVPLGVTAAGQPIVTGGLGISMAAAPPWIVMAAARNMQIGIDIATTDPLPDLAALCEHWLHPRERKFLATLSASQAAQAFYVLWTAREAYLKALGIGLIDDMTTIDASALLEAGVLASPVVDNRPGRHFWWYSLKTPGGLVATAAVSRSGVRVNMAIA